MTKLNFKSVAPPAPVDVARSYIAAGVAVFPCRERTTTDIDPATGEVVEFVEKSPLTTNGLKDASTSSRIVNILFGDRYPAAAIGVPTGEKLGGWVLDLDRHGDRDGHAWLAEMEAQHGALPDTPRATTANGGTHIFFKHVEGIRNRAAIAPGVDTRGEGGYILAPGSVMADGRRYQWLNHDGDSLPEFAEAPPWLVDMVVTKATPTTQTTTAPREYAYQPETDTGAARYASRAFDMELEKLASSPKGQRGQQLFASACSIGELVAAGLISRGEAERGLIDAAASNGLVATDGERKCHDKIKRGLDKTATTPRHIPERDFANDNTPPVDADRIVANTLAKQSLTGDSPADPPPEQKRRGRFDLTWFDEIEEGKPKETILKGWLGVGEFTTISGLPGTGKSVVTTDLACHIACGMDWHGQKVRQGLVVYVAAERKKLTERRMMAFRKHHGVENVPLLVVGGMLDFTRDMKDAEEVIKVIREAETITNQKCVWVIIDTLTRVFGAGDQNASKDMVRFVRSCDLIVSETGAHVTAIHHSSWSGERGKGAIDLDGAVDASFMVKKDGNKHRLVCDGTNDGEEGDVLVFSMKSVALGVDADGEPTTAPVVVPAVADEVAVEGILRNASKKNQAALDTLRRLIATSGRESPGGPHYPDDVVMVRYEDWRQACYDEAKSGTSQDAKLKAFKRASADLEAAGAIVRSYEWLWLG